MILIFIQQIEMAKRALQSAFLLSGFLKKEFGIMYFVHSNEEIHCKKEKLENFAEKENLSDAKIFVQKNELSELPEICEQLEASFLVLQLLENRSRCIQKQLNACRTLRIPYLIYKDSFPLLDLKKILVPVTFLEEEYEKAQFASAFGRFCNSEIHVLLANDYGSKAKTTADKMTQLFDKFGLNYVVEKAKGDSFKMEKESVVKAEKAQFGCIILSASRDYGLDDMLFGPKEQHLVKKSNVPLLLVNPRGDLYALCD